MADPDGTSTDHDFLIAGDDEITDDELRGLRSSLNSKVQGAKQVEVVPACGLGSQDTCRETARCPDGERMYDVYRIVAGERIGDPAPHCFEDEQPQARREITNAMVVRALRRVSLPKPQLSIQPPGGKTLVNFETIFSTDADSFRRTVRLLGRRVVLDITPTGFLWDYGDGTTETTSEPGIAWEKGRPMSDYLTHVYQDAHVTMQPRVAVTYGARFRVDNGPWRDVTGTVTSEGPTVDLRVIEGKTVLLS